MIDNWRFRTSWRGLLVLQRRVRDLRAIGPTIEPCMVWRDATTEDLSEYYRNLHKVEP